MFLQQEPITNPGETLTLAMVNDFHLEPDYTNKVTSYHDKWQPQFKLVDSYLALDDVARGVFQAVMKEAINQLDIFSIRYAASNNDQVDDLINRWNLFESFMDPAALEKVYQIFDEQFVAPRILTPWELCDYIERAIPKDGPNYSPLVTHCNMT